MTLDKQTGRQERPHETYRRLKEMLLQDQVKSEDKITDRELAKELGVSRTPVRDALQRLEQEGFLETRPGRRGYRVVQLDAKRTGDLYDFRELLEAHSVRLAAEHAVPSDLEELRQILATLEEYQLDPTKRSVEIWTGLKIHEIIAHASGNSALYEALVRLLERTRFLIWMEMIAEDPEAAERTRKEHARLVALIAEGRADEAEELVRSHIRTAKDHILRILTARERFYRSLNEAVVR